MAADDSDPEAVAVGAEEVPGCGYRKLTPEAMQRLIKVQIEFASSVVTSTGRLTRSAAA